MSEQDDAAIAQVLKRRLDAAPGPRPPIERVRERGSAIARATRRSGLFGMLALAVAGGGAAAGFATGGGGLRFVVTGSPRTGASCTVTQIDDFAHGEMYFAGSRIPGLVVFQGTFPRTLPTVTYRGQQYAVGPVVMSGVRFFRGTAPATTKVDTGVTRSGHTVTIDRSTAWMPLAGSTWVISASRNPDGSMAADGCETLLGTVSQVARQVFSLGNRRYTGDPVAAIEHGVPLSWWIHKR